MRLATDLMFLILTFVTKIRNEKLLRDFGRRLRELRISKGLSQESLAYKADVPISQIGRIERGEVNTTISTLEVLAAAIEIDREELLKF